MLNFFLLLGLASHAGVLVEAGKKGASPSTVEGHQRPPELSELIDDILTEDIVEIETEVSTGSHGALSHIKVAPVAVGNDRLKQIVAQSKMEQQQLALAKRTAESALQEQLTRLEHGACLDLRTPADGHCLFWALLEGGLACPAEMGDVQLDISELRAIAVSEASPHELEIAALGTPGCQTTEDYVNGMRQGLYGDMLVLGCLARVFNRDITVVSQNYARTYLAVGGDTDGPRDTAIWIAHRQVSR